MRALIATTVISLLTFGTLGTIDLAPAYSIRMSGSPDWTLVNTYDKQALFVEGFEMLDDETLIQSVGLYWGSKIQKLSINYEGANSFKLSEQ